MSEQQEPNFEESLAELEDLTRNLEAGELGLEAALAAFERGVSLVRRLHAMLDQAEQRVEVLTRDAQGGLRLEPLSDDDAP